MATSDLLRLEIATPLGLVLSTECESIAAPSVQGEFGVFANHLPLLAAMRAGVITYSVDGKDHRAAVGRGFAEAEPDRVLILTDAFALPGDVNTAEVADELSDAEQRLKSLDTEYEGTTFEEIQRDIEWAQARLAIARADS